MYLPNEPRDTAQLVNVVSFVRTLRKREYELKDHLGNVRVTISDLKLGNGSPVYSADIRSYTNHYAFGMVQPDRSWVASGGYRYGFNGKESDNEISGNGNQYDYGFRIYNPRIARFLSEDPLTKDYPSWSPYPFAMNRPIDGIDLDGLEWQSFQGENGEVNHIQVNVNFDQSGLVKEGWSSEKINELKQAISKKMNVLLSLSSNNQITGEVLFNGGDQEKIQRVIPKINFFNSTNDIAGMTTSYTLIGVNITDMVNGVPTPEDIESMAWTTIHELFHTIRLSHPFERTQGASTELIHVGGNNYKTTKNTDPNIALNLMVYNALAIDGVPIRSWREQRPLFYRLTADQIKIAIQEISLQMQGVGAKKNLIERDHEYWKDKNWPGVDVVKKKKK